MKSLQNIAIITALLWLAIGNTSCKKNGYLTDGGLANPYTSLTTYDYLKGNKYHYFDTTILLIDHFNLKDSVNKAGTFFAFTNYAVNALMLKLNVTSLDQLYDSVSSKLLTQYMFSDTAITLANATLLPVMHNNWASDTLKTAVKKIQGSYVDYLTSSAPVFNYYTLQYVKINGNADDPVSGPAPGDLLDAVTSCQTSGIKTASGTTLHVLVNNAVLNKL